MERCATTTRYSLLAFLPFATLSLANAGPVLPDWTAATFDGGSSTVTNQYFYQPTGLLSIFEGFVDDGELERIEVLSTAQTTTILGVEARVVRDSAYVDGLLVEVAEDWYAQDTAGNVWYFGESVVNYNYDDDGNLIGTDNGGSWIADGVTSLPGIVMFANPMIGDSYYQEFAPGVAFDFAVVESLTETVDISFGVFDDVLLTAEGNLFDGPEIVENKLYAPGVGLVLVQELDDAGAPKFQIELIEQRIVPAPAGGFLAIIACLATGGRRQRARTKLIA
jgi:hypothetical protein